VVVVVVVEVDVVEVVVEVDVVEVVVEVELVVEVEIVFDVVEVGLKVVEFEVEVVVEIVPVEIELELGRVEDSVDVDEVGFDVTGSSVEEIEVGPIDGASLAPEEADCGDSELVLVPPTTSDISDVLIDGFEFSTASAKA